ncbi:MAG TPA: Na+/H+ antiporter NhaA [Vicinamibacterales bacterium]
MRRAVDFAIAQSLALPIAAVLALVWANTFSLSYQQFARALTFPINDIGMAFFFGLAAKEIVEARAPGAALDTWRRAAMPVVAAVGGMVTPALLFVLLAHSTGHDQLLRGWAIPCATDIAFSAMVARSIFGRHPAVPFLLLLAIVDDALGLVVLALFYPAHELHIAIAIVLMAAAVSIAFLLRHNHVRVFWPYVFISGAFSWLALFWGGLHPALALVPIIPFLPHAPSDPGLFVEAPPYAHDALSEFEHSLRLPVQAVLFLFGLANAGVPLGSRGAGTWTVLTSVLVGKPLGIGLAVALAVVAGLQLPARLRWQDVVVVGCTASIGFTVALFFATAAFPPGETLAAVKTGALLSIVGAALAISAAKILGAGRFRASPAEYP